MNPNEYLEKYNEEVNKEVKLIKDLLKNGASIKSLFLEYDFYPESLQKANIPISFLKPSEQSQKLSLEEMESHIPNEGKWEYFNGHYFDENGYGEEKLFMMLLTKIGLKRFLEIMPKESIETLIRLLESKNINIKNKPQNFEVLFSYSNEDFEVYRKLITTTYTNEPYYNYHVTIEPFIAFESIEECILLYKDFLKEYSKQFKSLPTDNNKEYIYKTYHIEIFKENDYYIVYTNCPELDSEEECYLWLEGIIKELENIKNSKRF